MKVNLLEFSKFGALYGLIISALLSVITWLFFLLIFPKTPILGIFATLVLITIGTIIGAAVWTINGVIYRFFNKQVYDTAKWFSVKLGSSVVFWQLVILGLIFSVISNIILGQTLISLGNIIAVLVGSYIVITVAGVLKLKIPVRK